MSSAACTDGDGEHRDLPWDRSKLLEVEKDYEKDIENLGREFHLELDEALPEGEKLPRDPDGSFNLRPRTTGSVRLGTKQFAGFNIGSPKQLLEKLTLVLGETPLDPKKRTPSASRQALREYAGASHRYPNLFGLEKGREAPPDGGISVETPGCRWSDTRQLLAAWYGDRPDVLQRPQPSAMS